MKKTLILAGIFLLPLLVSAYELDPEYANFAKELNVTVKQETINKVTEAKPSTRKEKIKKVKQLIRRSQNTFDESSWSGGFGTGGSGGYVNLFSHHRYYNTADLSVYLNEEDLKAFLANDKDALDEVADYTTEHRRSIIAHNDFETLLVLGVDPFEAAVRTNSKMSITREIETNEFIYKIEYPHCYLETFRNSTPMVSSGHSTPKTENREITGSATFKEIMAIKQKFQKKESSWDWNDSNIKSVLEGFQQEAYPNKY